MKKIIQLPMLCVGVLALTNCAEAPLNHETINQYNDYTLTHFIKMRFTVNNAMNNAFQQTLKVAAQITRSDIPSYYSYYNRSEPMPDGSYVYYAVFFKDKMLEHPKMELNAFCQMKGGQLIKERLLYKSVFSALSDQDKLGHPEWFYKPTNPSFMHSKKDSNISIFGNKIGTLHHNELEPSFNKPRLSRRAPLAESEFNTAYKNQAFGVFNCKNQQTNKILWRVTITPLFYESADPKRFLSDALYIGIKAD